jgi:hypothetical protein
VPIDVLRDVFQEVMGPALGLRVVAHVQEAFKVHGRPPEEQRVSGGK